MARRKTISVEAVRKIINDALESKRLSQDAKSALATTLERILFDTGNYHGFQYLYWAKEGYQKWVEAGKPSFPEKEQFIGPEYDRVYY